MNVIELKIIRYGFMIRFGNKDKIFIVGLLLLMLSGCASLSSTNANLREFDRILEKPQPKKQVLPSASKSKTPDNPGGPVPLEVFAGGSIIAAPDFLNRWYPRLVNWAETYKSIAKEEINMRNFKLSEKYSKEAVLWAQRAKTIQKMDNEKAFSNIQPWILDIKTPSVEPVSEHFLSKEVYEKNLIAKNRLDELSDRICLINQGFAFVPTMAYLEISVDLMNQTYFDRSLQSIQRVLSPLEGIEKIKLSCIEESEESEESTE
jgi:hypothetical protein